MSSSYPNWLDLPSDHWAADISRKHLTSIPDYLSFRGVCTSWRSIATFHNFDFTATPRVPWLMYASIQTKEIESSYKRDITIFSNLFDLSTKMVHKTINSYPADGRMCPSSRGWLLCVSVSNNDVYLTHPLSRARIELPGSDTFPENYRFVGKMVLSRSPREKKDDDFVVMVVWGARGQSSNKRLGFSRPGDGSWTVMDGRFSDILYHDGKLYAVVDDSNSRALQSITVVECDIHGPNPTETSQVFSLPYGNSPFAIVRNMVNDESEYEYILKQKYYLLESGGKFVIVIRHTLLDVKTLLRETIDFEVFEFDLKDGSHMNVHPDGPYLGFEWNKTLFLGFDSSVWDDVSDGDVVKPNCIYFTDDEYWKTRTPFDMGECDLKTMAITRGVLGGFSGSDCLTPPTWVMPTF